MTLHHKAYAAQTATVGERQVSVVVSTSQIDRAGEIVVQSGIELDAYRMNPVVLWSHDPDQPIAKAVEIGLSGEQLTATVQFPPEGDDPKADLIYRRVRNGIINAVSIGFAPIETELMPGGDRKEGPFKYVRSDLMEFSFVSVPANPGAAVVARALKGRTVMAKKAAPHLAAAHLVTALGAGSIQKGFGEIGSLARQLNELGWLKECVDWEAEREGDASTVPAQLALALAALGKVLVAMTVEEVAEMIAANGIDPDTSPAEAEADPDDIITMAVAKSFRAGFAKAAKIDKAGRTISSANAKALETACKSIMEGHDIVKGMIPADDDAGEEDAQKAAREAVVKAAARAKRLRQVEVLRLSVPA